MKRTSLLAVLSTVFFLGTAQIANYVNNGSFEELYNCQLPNDLNKAKYWRSIDSVFAMPGVFSSCSGMNNSPSNAYTYQWARTGYSYALGGFFCPPPTCSALLNRVYLRNRLKKTLVFGKTYCVKFYVNICNNSTYGMDGFGAYFGDNTLDTITKSGVPLTYLTPQVQNLSTNLVIDTLAWTLISGTFVANGSERYLVIGNFKSDATTNSLLINSTYSPAIATDVCIDDVSCIDIDLPAFAGLDTFFIPGSSLYLGRERDVGIDEACIWYQLPNMATALDTAAGIWVTPVGTSTYVVRQEICGNIKWDTVVVRESPLGLEDLRLNNQRLKLWPQPTKEELVLQLDNYSGSTEVFIYNNLGMMVRREDLFFKENKTNVRINELAAGSYVLELRAKERSYRSKLVVER